MFQLKYALENSDNNNNNSIDDEEDLEWAYK